MNTEELLKEIHFKMNKCFSIRTAKSIACGFLLRDAYDKLREVSEIYNLDYTDEEMSNLYG